MVELTRTNSEKLFGLPSNPDFVLVDLSLEKEVRQEELASKCGWSPYHGRVLRGWPLYTILGGRVFCASQGTVEGKQQLEAVSVRKSGRCFCNSSINSRQRERIFLTVGCGVST